MNNKKTTEKMVRGNYWIKPSQKKKVAKLAKSRTTRERKVSESEIIREMIG